MNGLLTASRNPTSGNRGQDSYRFPKIILAGVNPIISKQVNPESYKVGSFHYLRINGNDPITGCRKGSLTGIPAMKDQTKPR